MDTYSEDEEYDDDEEFTPEYAKLILDEVEKLRRGELETRSLADIDREYGYTEN